MQNWSGAKINEQAVLSDGSDSSSGSENIQKQDSDGDDWHDNENKKLKEDSEEERLSEG